MNSIRAASGCQEARDMPGRSGAWELGAEVGLYRIPVCSVGHDE